MSTREGHIQDSATVFSFMWAAAQLFDLLAFPDWVRYPSGIAHFLAVIAVLIKPSGSSRFLAFCLTNLVYLWVQAPDTATHIWFQGFVSLAVCWAVLRNRKIHPGSARREAVYIEAAPALRILVAGLYVFAALHKLNWDFFDPAVSCAGFMLGGITDRLGLPRPNLFVQDASIWATLIFEAGIPLLLISARTRPLALLIAWPFHLMLSIHPRPGIPGFSAMMLAMLSLYLPVRFFDLFRSRLWAQRLLDGSMQWALRPEYILGAIGALGSAGALAILAGVDITGQGLSYWPRLVGHLAYVVYACFLLAAWFTVWPHGTSLPGERLPGTLRTPVLVVVALAALSCLAPYLGLQTHGAMSMFSNLRTEAGRTNHLFIPRSLQIASYQDDVVSVSQSSHPWFAYFRGPDYLHPYMELRRQVWEHPGQHVRITFEHEGQVIEFDSADPNATSVLPPPPFPLNKILMFRPVNNPGPQSCLW